MSVLICSHCTSLSYGGAGWGSGGLAAVVKLNTGLGSEGTGFVAETCQK